ncbi:unnamed protein product [Schistocephalus solidus]|uniref:Uncharacterized protein n=1 Tax=Schistocephalus solidus TaxID=70667 RepID=A0A183TP80_SCHSO|nr:unnamed protein product [Schistocephalus solidus]
MGEPRTDMHVTTPQSGADEGAVVNTATPTTIPTDEETCNQKDTNRTSNPEHQLRSMRTRARAANCQTPPLNEKHAKRQHFPSSRLLRPGDYRNASCVRADANKAAVVRGIRLVQQRLREIQYTWMARKAEEIQEYKDCNERANFFKASKALYGP